jgi:hypothetical protein
MIARPTPTPDDLRAVEDRRRRVRARWRFTLMPVGAMLLMMAIFAPPALVGWVQYDQIVPLFLVFGAIVVFFIGSWYDFGAKGYVSDLVRNRQPVTDEDLDRIHREQFIMTLCYSGVAGLYFFAALVIYHA